MKYDVTCYPDRRMFLRNGVMGIMCSPLLSFLPRTLLAGDDMKDEMKIKAVIRPETLFAGIRKPIQKRADLEPRIKQLKTALNKKITGPLTHIFRFDTPVEGYDSEIGFPVSEPVNTGEIITHKLRSMSFFSSVHNGPVTTLGETTKKLYEYMKGRGLSPELELVEVYHTYDTEKPENMVIENMASFLAWPEVYREQLMRVLKPEQVTAIWVGGERIHPHTPVDQRCQWVERSINKLKKFTNDEQQFDILSRVALIRPIEDVMKYKTMYNQNNKDINVIFEAQNKELEKTNTGGFVDPPRFDGKILHISKVPYNRKAYNEAKTPEEIRKAFCFCALVREAKNPKIDPIFCYRAAGWSRQFWEPILETTFTKCTITHSILKGDPFCAWDYHIG